MRWINKENFFQRKMIKTNHLLIICWFSMTKVCFQVATELICFVNHLLITELKSHQAAFGLVVVSFQAHFQFHQRVPAFHLHFTQIFLLLLWWGWWWMLTFLRTEVGLQNAGVSTLGHFLAFLQSIVVVRSSPGCGPCFRPASQPGLQQQRFSWDFPCDVFEWDLNFQRSTFGELAQNVLNVNTVRKWITPVQLSFDGQPLTVEFQMFSLNFQSTAAGQSNLKFVRQEADTIDFDLNPIAIGLHFIFSINQSKIFSFNHLIDVLNKVFVRLVARQRRLSSFVHPTTAARCSFRRPCRFAADAGDGGRGRFVDQRQIVAVQLSLGQLAGVEKGHFRNGETSERCVWRRWRATATCVWIFFSFIKFQLKRKFGNLSPKDKGGGKEFNAKTRAGSDDVDCGASCCRPEASDTFACRWPKTAF